MGCGWGWGRCVNENMPVRDIESACNVQTFKVSGTTKENVKKSLEKIVNKFWDIRQN